MKSKIAVIYFIIANVLILNIGSVFADVATGATSTIASKGAGKAASDSGIMDNFKKYFDSPAGVAVIAGIATVYSTTLYKAAGKQEEESKANIKKLDKIIAEVKGSYVNLCPNGREDLKVPACYCYLSTGKKNDARSNSQICKEQWAKNSYSFDGTSTPYSAVNFTNDVAGCVMVDGQFDQQCKCKKLVDAKGNNACKKETKITLPNDNFSNGFAIGSGLPTVLNFASNATNGNPRLDLMDSGSLNANAVRVNQIKDQLMTKLPKGTTIPKIDESNVHKYAAAVLGTKNMNAALTSSGGSAASAVGAARSDNPAVENMLKQAQAKAGLDLMGGSGRGLDGSSDVKKDGLNFNFNEVGSGGAGAGVVQGFQEEDVNYKYKNSDIVKDNGSSIFEIISNRYIQSGLKRLFEEEEIKK